MDKSLKRESLFSSAPVWKAVAHLALPTIVSQVILVLYNMADTFFIGQNGTDAMITAAAVCMPAFMILSAVSNLFGIGAVGVISRANGAGNPEKAREASSFAFWGCFAASALYGFLCFVFRDPYVNLLGGGSPSVHGFAAGYLFWTVTAGGIVTAENTLMGHLMRAEGRSLAASVGISLGGVLNILLDPLFIFVIFPHGQEVKAAALATLP
jgi:Na+-driven multidrug efflux pump